MASISWNRARGTGEDRVVGGISFTLLVVGQIGLVLILIFMVRESWPAFRGTDASDLMGFLFRESWSPLEDPPRLGLFHAWVSTLMISGLSLVIAVPLGFGIACFLSDVAPRPVQAILQPCLELLAGIPSVVYGFFGYVTVVKFCAWRFGLPTGESVLAAGVILAVMSLPFIAGTAAEAFRAVPHEQRESALALGVTRWHMIRRVVVPCALPGLFAAVALGLARSVGETLAVLILSGNSVAPPKGLLSRAQPITALIATELGEAEVHSLKYHRLFASGLLLLVVVMSLNLLIWALKRRLIRNG